MINKQRVLKHRKQAKDQAGKASLEDNQEPSEPTSDADDKAIFNEALKEFEQQHPDTSIEDLLAVNKQLPEDTPFARIVN